MIRFGVFASAMLLVSLGTPSSAQTGSDWTAGAQAAASSGLSDSSSRVVSGESVVELADAIKRELLFHVVWRERAGSPTSRRCRW